MNDTIVYRDTFDGVALGPYWDGAYSFGGVEVSGGHLSLTCDPNYSGVDHRTLMDLSADGWRFRAKTFEFPTPSGAAVRDVYMILFDSSTGNQFWIGLAGDTLQANSHVGGGGSTTLLGSAPFVLADMIWWQLRRENGKIHFEYSADGEGWTSIATIDPPYDISTMRLELGVGSDITGFSQDKWVIEEFGQYAAGVTISPESSNTLSLSGRVPDVSAYPDLVFPDEFYPDQTGPELSVATTTTLTLAEEL